jgi:CdiI N-terminal domain
MAFSIQVIARKRRIGRIKIGRFSEPFQISGRWSLKKFEFEWERQVRGLAGRRRKAMLPESATAGEVFRAWILYRDSEKLYVQQRHYIRRPFRYGRSRIHARKVRDDEGRKLSDWSVSLEAVTDCLKLMKPNRQTRRYRQPR